MTVRWGSSGKSPRPPKFEKVMKAIRRRERRRPTSNKRLWGRNKP